MRACAKKYWVLKFVTVVTIVCIVCPAAIADDANKPAQRAPFEQRMKKPISVDFRNTPIDDVIRIMADQADVDIVKSPAVTGAVTVTLTNVPLEEAINNILAAHGYSYVLSENMIRVITAVEKAAADKMAAEKAEKPELLQTKVYEIVYADVKEVVKALDKFKSKQGTVSSIEGTSHIIVNDTESKIKEITAFIEKIDRMTPQILVEVRIYDITSKENFDIGTDWYIGRNTPIKEIARTKTSGRTGTKTNTNTTTNNSTTTGTTTDVGVTGPTTTTNRTVTDTIDTIDPANTGTVDKTVTTTSSGTGGRTGDTTTITSTAGSTSGTTLGDSITSSDTITETTADTWHLDADGNPLPFRKSSPFMGGQFSKEEGGTLRFGVLNDAVDIDLALSILHKQVGAKLLANPRILVLDNEKATIDITSEIPYQRLTESAMGGSMGTTEFKEVGVKLEVTPHLAARDEMIRLQLKPEFSVKTSDVIITTTGAGARYPIPVVDKRTADTRLLIKNGQTVVLGGLRKKETTQDVRKVPLLGDLPVFGNLFRSESEETVDSEIVVFITVWIIKQPVMSKGEQDAYKVTEFKGPKPAFTGAETDKDSD